MGSQVHYSVAVIDAATGREVMRLPRKRNLILDQGLDGIAARSWAASFTQAVIGTGTDPTKRDSGAVTFSRAGTTVTASAGFFEAADVGRLLKWDTGEEVYVTAFTDASTVTVATSGTIAAGEGTIWYVNQTGLTTETKRTGTLSADSGAHGTVWTGGTATMKRTFIFSAETGTVNYREIGWSYTASAGANLFGRDLLDGVGVTLVSGQQLRVTVELSLTLSPATPTAYVSAITGWTQNGQMVVPSGSAAISIVSTTGAITARNGLEPSSAKNVSVSASTAALGDLAEAFVNPNTAGVLATVAATAASYVAGSFTRTFSGTLGIAAGNSTSIRTLWLAGNAGSDAGLRVLLAAAETKDSDHTLSLTFRVSWGRILTN